MKSNQNKTTNERRNTVAADSGVIELAPYLDRDADERVSGAECSTGGTLVVLPSALWLRASVSVLSRISCSLGAKPEDVAHVLLEAARYRAWRNQTFPSGRDGACEMSAWLRAGGPSPAGKVDLSPTSTRGRSPDAWALARLAVLLQRGLTVADAVTQAVAIPLDTGQFSHRSAPSDRSERGRGVEVLHANVAEFRMQRLVATRLVVVDFTGCPHDGCLAVPASLARRYGWSEASF